MFLVLLIISALSLTTTLASATTPPYPLTARYGHNNSSPIQYVGCNQSEISNISLAFNDAIKMAKAIGTIDFINDPAAMDFFGPPSMNYNDRAGVAASLSQVAQYPWEVAAYCPAKNDQLVGNYCYGALKALDLDSSSKPYVNGSQATQNASIHILFCDAFFTQPSLGQRINQAVSGIPGINKFRLDKYGQNTGTSFLRALLHSPILSSAVHGSPIPDTWGLVRNSHTDLLRIGFFGAINSKILARTLHQDNKTFINNNAENYVQFVLAKYVQNKIGEYPWLPNADSQAFSNPDKDPFNLIINTSSGYNWRLNETIISQVNNNYSGYYEDCYLSGTCDPSWRNVYGLPNSVLVDLTGSRWLGDSEFPPEYISNRSAFMDKLRNSSSTSVPTNEGSQPPAVRRCANPGNDVSSSAVVAFNRSDASPLIQSICNEGSLNPFLDDEVVPNISFGNGTTTDDKTKQSPWYSDKVLPGNKTLWTELSVNESSCENTFRVGSAFTGNNKTSACMDTFMQIINGCDTRGLSPKYGGTLTIGCMVFTVHATLHGKVDPLLLTDYGTLVCNDTDSAIPSSLPSITNGVCACYYSNFPNAGNVFCKPSTGCSSILKRPDWDVYELNEMGKKCPS